MLNELSRFYPLYLFAFFKLNFCFLKKMVKKCFVTFFFWVQNLQISSSTEKNRTCPKNHELKLKNNCKKCYLDEYTCHGCKVDGFGMRYRCDKCDYDLHRACMHSTPTTTRKLLDSTFKFYDQLPRNCNGCKRDCDACGKEVKGFVYHCHKKDLVFHPCCCDLKNELEYDGMKFHLCKTESNCAKKGCKQKKGWSYVSGCGKCNFHVYCMGEMFLESKNKGKSISIDDLKNLELPIQRQQLERNGGMGPMLLKIAKVILGTIVSIFIGDPTTALASILVNLVFN